ncbi:FAD-binding oxidoreductase [Quadrisphaera sp. DSM 44207]|uniref:FAD-binding oxidoreductase n=1 Tax=Quadrisphaera sp. DSM 44207 TaxID=1881057 RepID=UPI000882594C|nr:FAD-binding oxidoreductase [Quadrisphaera sp. DSM 44207]SDQ42393.1 glycolate oxidase FAD binding subunit [Quadrisphaera sp. DSM 44207]
MAVLSADRESVRRSLAAACADVRDATAADAVDGVAPALVARPASTEQTAQVLRAAAAHSLVVVPRGRGTKLTWGRPPERVDLVLDTTAMGAVVDHAAGDLIVQVQAGAALADVQAAVAGAGQRLALDETAPGATVGGTLATGASGPLRVAAGTARDLLIGVTLVRADGVVAKAGGRVVKNVAGYDLGKLLVGSYGTLAVITEAVFRLHPLPAERRVLSAGVDSPGQAHRLAQAVVHSQVVPSALEVDWPADGPGVLSVLLEGTPGGVEARTASAAALLGAGARVGADLPQGWGRYPWAVGGTGLKLTSALSGLAAVLSAVQACAEGAGVRPAVRGSAGAGVLHAGLPPGTAPAAAAEVVARLRAACAEHGGACVVLEAPPEVEDAVDAWGPVPGLDLMRRVKEQFDPERRLAPGRFVGGI